MLTLVLLPGMDGTGQLFEPFIAALGSQFKVIVVKYPTVGALGYEPLETIARRSLPASGPFVILGESFSGPIAISLTASQPRGLVGLALCSTFARNPRPAFAALRPFIGALPVQLAPMAALSYLLLGRFTTPALRSALGACLAQVCASSLRARIKAVLSVDVSSQLKAIKVPLLYLLATEDRVVPANAAKDITQAVPTARVVPIEAPHFLLQTAPAAAAAAVSTFVHHVHNSGHIVAPEPNTHVHPPHPL